MEEWDWRLIRGGEGLPARVLLAQQSMTFTAPPSGLVTFAAFLPRAKYIALISKLVGGEGGEEI